MQEYLTDLENDSLAANQGGWGADYVRYVPLLFAEAQVKTILETDQWNRWQESGVLTRHQWALAQTKKLHELRVKVIGAKGP